MLKSIDELKKKLANDFDVKIEELNVRADGRIEWVCEHSVGHTIWFPKGSDSVHGCDGCCQNLKKQKGQKQENDLKPCPLCSGKPKLVKWDMKSKDETDYYIVCLSCGLLSSLHASKNELIKYWNKRTI